MSIFSRAKKTYKLTKNALKVGLIIKATALGTVAVPFVITALNFIFGTHVFLVIYYSLQIFASIVIIIAVIIALEDSVREDTKDLKVYQREIIHVMFSIFIGILGVRLALIIGKLADL